MPLCSGISERSNARVPPVAEIIGSASPSHFIHCSFSQSLPLFPEDRADLALNYSIASYAWILEATESMGRHESSNRRDQTRVSNLVRGPVSLPCPPAPRLEHSQPLALAAESAGRAREGVSSAAVFSACAECRHGTALLRRLTVDRFLIANCLRQHGRCAPTTENNWASSQDAGSSDDTSLWAGLLPHIKADYMTQSASCPGQVLPAHRHRTTPTARSLSLH